MVTQESINYIAEGLAGRRKVEFLQIVQQRAELLEELKGVQKSLGHMMHPNQKAAVVAAITRAAAQMQLDKEKQ